MSTKILLVIVVVIIAAAAAFGLSKLNTGGEHVHPPGTPPHEHHQEVAPSSNEEQQTASVIIVYTDNGFEKSTYTIKAGETVQIQNNSGFMLEFYSDPHPVHTQQPELNIGAIPPDETVTFTVDAKGTWGFHNHLRQDHTGTLIVE